MKGLGCVAVVMTGLQWSGQGELRLLSVGTWISGCFFFLLPPPLLSCSEDQIEPICYKTSHEDFMFISVSSFFHFTPSLYPWSIIYLSVCLGIYLSIYLGYDRMWADTVQACMIAVKNGQLFISKTNQGISGLSVFEFRATQVQVYCIWVLTLPVNSLTVLHLATWRSETQQHQCQVGHCLCREISGGGYSATAVVCS